MAGTDNPQKKNKPLGDLVSTYRNQRHMSRAQLVDKALALLDADDPDRKLISDSSIRELEEGNRANPPRRFLQILLEALGCSVSQRIDIMIAADRNAFADEDGTVSEAAETFIRGVEIIYLQDSVARSQIDALLKNRKASSLNEDELFEILEVVILQAAARRRKESKQSKSLRTGIANR